MLSDWMFALASACQRFICEAVTLPLQVVPDVARASVGTVPQPPTPLAAAVMRSTLIELAVRWGYERHQSLSGFCPAPNCDPVALARLGAQCHDFALRPREMFIGWVDEFCRELVQTHHEQLARRVAALIRDSPTAPLNVRRIAKEVGAHESSIRRAFHREFHMSLRQYHTETRVAFAERLLRDSPKGKIEAVAILAGWHSKKGFYRAVLRSRGCTPGNLRVGMTTRLIVKPSS